MSVLIDKHGLFSHEKMVSRCIYHEGKKESAPWDIVKTKGVGYEEVKTHLLENYDHANLPTIYNIHSGDKDFFLVKRINPIVYVSEPLAVKSNALFFGKGTRVFHPKDCDYSIYSQYDPNNFELKRIMKVKDLGDQYLCYDIKQFDYFDDFILETQYGSLCVKHGFDFPCDLDPEKIIHTRYFEGYAVQSVSGKDSTVLSTVMDLIEEVTIKGSHTSLICRASNSIMVVTKKYK